MKLLRILPFTFLALSFLTIQAQEKEASPFDFGRMWTFENPPTEWFEEAYGFEADKAWFDDVRKSSLRFASWCSASFVSPNGLIMTNHHCSRDEAIKVQFDGENFDNNGFYAASLGDERKIEGLYVEQLIQVADITEQVLAAAKNAENDAQAIELKTAALEKIQEEFSNRKDWMNLRLQTVTYYSGGKYSLYGYKKYDDIRLVLMPENDLGAYGGDPDNFTFPRYSLDFTFWRAYDEQGNPVNTSNHYYEFNTDGVVEGEPVFVVGNPGRTERYRTVAQLEYDRDYRFKHLLRWITNRRDMMLGEYDMIKTDASKEREAQELLGTITNLSNSIKAYTGIVGGLHNEAFMKRKADMENSIKKESGGMTIWGDLEDEYNKLAPQAWAISHLSPNRYRDAPKEELEEAKTAMLETADGANTPKEKKLFNLWLNELKEDIYPGDNTLSKLLGGNSIAGFTDNLFEKSKMLGGKESAMKCLSKAKNIKKAKDPIVNVGEMVSKRLMESQMAFQNSGAKRRGLEAKIANQAFNVYGTSLPPDATFTLRISDGMVKRYEYNGTVAPIMTTYFGMYDRHYSNNKAYPWSLPERWANPPMDLLKAPVNFVSTNDIIGGNSGSAIINKKGEAVGLIFDGNIESLPGNFIFDEEHNRSISVHAGGIIAAMQYIYKADRIVGELKGK